MQLRKARPGDAVHLQQLLAQAGRKAEPGHMEVQLLSGEMPDVLVYDAGRHAVALTEVYVLPVFGSDRCFALVSCVVVNENLRYSGIGSEMIGRLIHWARNRNCSRLQVIGPQPDEVTFFYELLGFRLEGGSWIKDL